MRVTYSFLLQTLQTILLCRKLGLQIGELFSCRGPVALCLCSLPLGFFQPLLQLCKSLSRSVITALVDLAFFTPICIFRRLR